MWGIRRFDILIGSPMDLADDEEVDDAGLDEVETLGGAMRSAGPSWIGSESRTVPMVLTWNRKLSKARSNPLRRDPKSRRCAGECGVNSREPKKICSARVDDPTIVWAGAGESMIPACELPTDGAN